MNPGTRWDDPNAPADLKCRKCGHVHTVWFDVWDNGMTDSGFTCKCGCTYDPRDEDWR